MEATTNTAKTTTTTAMTTSRITTTHLKWLCDECDVKHFRNIMHLFVVVVVVIFCLGFNILQAVSNFAWQFTTKQPKAIPLKFNSNNFSFNKSSKFDCAVQISVLLLIRGAKATTRSVVVSLETKTEQNKKEKKRTEQTESVFLQYGRLSRCSSLSDNKSHT